MYACPGLDEDGKYHSLVDLVFIDRHLVNIACGYSLGVPSIELANVPK